MVIPEHVGRLQLFVIDHIELLNQLQRRFVLEIGSLAAYLLVCFGQQLHCFTAAIAAFLAARHLALGRFQAALSTAIAAGL